jgi:hypothetical protein
MVLVILAVFIPIYGKSTWTQTIVSALILTLLLYLLGDLWVLPKYGNGTALVVDFLISAAFIWTMDQMLPQTRISGFGIVVIAGVLTLGEWLFHFYLLSTTAYGKKAKIE